MKNQYAGDLHDYRKLGILRMLANLYQKTGVVWMLTENDGRPDGGKTPYLLSDNCRRKYRKFDADLYDRLRDKFVENNTFIPKEKRNVCKLQEILEDLNKSKFEFYKSLEEVADTKNIDLLFFDPDNGIGNSEKHLSWDDIKKYKDKDLLIVHFLRQRTSHDDRKVQVRSIQQGFEKINQQVLAIKGGDVVYFFVSNSQEKIKEVSEAINKAGGNNVISIY